MGYFPLNCSSILGGINFNYGSSFKYEIILNGNSIKFSTNDFKYKINNDKIIFQGYLDASENNYNEKNFIEMSKKENKKFDIKKVYYKEYEWVKLRIRQLIPDSLKLKK